MDPRLARFFESVAANLVVLKLRLPGVLCVVVGAHRLFVDGTATPPTCHTNAQRHPTPDVTLTCQEADLLAIVRGELSLMSALVRQKIKVTGQRALLRAIAPALQLALASAGIATPAAARSSAVGPAVSASTLASASATSIDADSTDGAEIGCQPWVGDHLRTCCHACKAPFSFIRRRHHCRICGEIFCDDCTQDRYREYRICAPCRSHLMAMAKENAMTGEGEESPAFVEKPVAGGLLMAGLAESVATGLTTRIAWTSPGPRGASAHSASTSDAGGTDYLAATRHAPVSTAANSSMSPGVMLLLGAVLGALCVLLLTAGQWATAASPLAPLFGLADSSLWLDYIQSAALNHGWRLAVIHPAVWAAIAGTLVAGIYLLRRGVTRQLLVFWTAILVFGSYQWLKWRMRRSRLSPAAEQQRWDALHTRNAKFVLARIKRLRGFWVKVGQYLSSRSDVLPPEWMAPLAELQDSLPFDDADTVMRNIAAALGPIEAVFSDVDKVPLASASIAQVHRATLKDKGQKVIVKVQHPNVATIMRSDFANLNTIVRWVAWFEPDYDFRQVIDAWLEVAMLELDFEHEAANMIRVRDVLIANNVDVIVPRPIAGLVTPTVIVMEFCDGFKVTDCAKLELLKIDRDALLQRVAQAFAVQIFADGFFNADPHPGNILVNITDGVVRPVLLDFGLCKPVRSNVRLALANMVSAVDVMDFGGLMQSFADMGLVFRRSNPWEDMNNIRFVLRDTAPAAEMRADFQKFRQDQENKLKDLPKSARRNPVEAWPSELMFFFRVVFLLRGLGATLGSRLPYLKTLTPHARLALLREFPLEAHAKVIVPPSSLGSVLQRSVNALLRRLHRAGEVIGIQVAVYRQGMMLVDSCAGTLGEWDPRPVRPDTLFVGFSVTKALAAVCLQMLLDRRLLSLSDKVAQHWPGFAQNGKGDITIEHVLTHRAGLHDFVGAEMDMASVTDWRAVMDRIAQLTPSTRPGTETHYHMLSFGWLVGGIVEAVSGMSIQAFVAAKIADRIGFPDELLMGLPAETPMEHWDGRLAQMANFLLRDMRPPEALVSGDSEKPPTAAPQSPQSPLTAAPAADDDEPEQHAFSAEMRAMQAEFSPLVMSRPHEGWEVMFEQDGVTALRQPVPGSDMSVMRGETDVPVPAALVFEMLSETNRKGEWDKMFVTGQELERVSETCLVGFEEFKAIWPVAGRGFLTLKAQFRLPDGRFLLVGKSIDDHPRVVPNDKLVRATVLAGFLITPLSADSCHLVYTARVDLKGNIPAFIVKQVSKDTPMTVAAIRRVAQKRLQTRDFVSLQSAPPTAAVAPPPRLAPVQNATPAASATPAAGAGPEPNLFAEVLQSVGLGPHAVGNKSHSLLLDPCVFNNPRVRQACIPAANGHFSARALATFYGHLLPGAPSGPLITDERRDDMCTMRGEEASGLGAMTYGLGVRKYQFLRPTQRLSSSTFGHSGLGGSMAFADPETGVAVAILVNRLSFDASATQQVLAHISRELGLGTFLGQL